MGKVLRFILILIVILFVGYLILCATSSATMEIERSATINAPKAVVWNQVVDLNNYENRSPWKEQDSTITSTITGPTAQPGQKSSWTSEKSGSGTMTISSIEGTTMSFDMHFIEPFEGDAKGKTTVAGTDGEVKVTTHYSQEASFFMRGMNSLFTKKFMGSMFERELELLKEYCESGKAAMPGYDIQDITYPATTFATIRKTVPMSEMDAFYEEAYGKIFAAAGDKVTGPTHTIIYEWDETNGQADMAAAVPVSGAIASMTMVTIPEGEGHKLKMVGAYTMDNFTNAHMAIGKYAAEHGLTDPLVIEEYATGPEQEADSNQYITNIYYLNK